VGGIGVLKLEVTRDVLAAVLDGRSELLLACEKEEGKK